MLINISAFAGTNPRTAAHHLDGVHAQRADNCLLNSGELRPLRDLKAVRTMPADSVHSFVLYQGTKWLGWPVEARVLPGLIAGDEKARMYMTDSAARMFCADDVTVDEDGNATVVPVLLGVPAPVTAPAICHHPKVNMQGRSDLFCRLRAAVDETVYSKHEVAWPDESDDTGKTLESVTYVYTVVSALGEESAPSPASQVIDVYAGEDRSTVTLIGLALPDLTEYRAADKIRLYRSLSGSTGTEFQFLAEIDKAEVEYSDAKNGEDLEEVLPSRYWTLPPSGAQGLTSLPGAVFACFSGREVALSDPLYPHAWPREYRHTLEYEVVAMAATGRTLVILTKANVYTMYVDDPATAVPQRLDGYLPCVSSLGVVETPAGVLFPALDGLYLVQSGALAAVNITAAVHDEASWTNLNPASFRAVYYAGQYIAFYESLAGEKRGLIIEPGSEASMVRGLGLYAEAVHLAPEGRKLYLAQPAKNGTNIFEWGGATERPIRAEWRSSQFRSKNPCNFTCALVEADYPPVMSELEYQEQQAKLLEEYAGLLTADEGRGQLGASMIGEVMLGGDRHAHLFASYMELQVVTFVLIGDGVERYRRNVITGQPFTLPSGYTATAWEIHVASDVPVKRAAVSTSMSELLGGIM